MTSTADGSILIDGAPPPASTVSGSIVFVDVFLIEEDVPFDVSGATALIGFEDLTSSQVMPTIGTGNIGECTVTKYSKSQNLLPRTQVDQGTVTLTGALHEVPPCTFTSAEVGYQCPAIAKQALPNGSTVVHTSIGGPLGVASELTVTGVDFAALDPAGMQVELVGFTNAVNNGVFGILSAPSTNTIQYFNNGPPVPLVHDETASGAQQYAVLGAAGPTLAVRDFLDDGTNEMTVTKTAGPLTEAFTVTLRANGEGFTLAGDSAAVNALPDTRGTGAGGATEPVTFSCASDAGGDCGPNTAPLLNAIVVAGETTDGDTTGLDAFVLPEPADEWAVFQCSFLNQETATLSAEVIDAIFSTEPTRIQTAVLNGAAVARFNGDGTNRINVLAGHGVVGFTSY